MHITQERLRDLFSYRDDGRLIRKINRSANARSDGLVGAKNENGYFVVSIEKRKYRCHRLIFLWHHGWLPEFVDHIDRDRSNNRIGNLRPATRVQQNANMSINKTKTSGFKGVSRVSHGDSWRAYISVCNKYKHLGCYTTAEAAADAYDQAARILHGDFAATNVALGRKETHECPHKFKTAPGYHKRRHERDDDYVKPNRHAKSE